MANDGISRIKTSPASGFSSARGAGGVGKSGSANVNAAAQRVVNGDVSGTSSSASSSSTSRQAAPRPIISVDGQDLNRTARRGTYLNILV